MSAYYYLRLPVVMYMHDLAQDERTQPSTNELVVLLICAAATLYLGFLPDANLSYDGVRLVDSLGHIVGQVGYSSTP